MIQDKRETKQIDLNTYGATIFTGRKNGAGARQHFNLDAFDDNYNLIMDIIFPENTTVLNSSFLLGMLGPSIQKQGSKEAFEAKFRFPKLSNTFHPSVEEAIERALRKKVNITFDGK